MSRLTVDPQALVDDATQARRAVEELAAVARAVAALGSADPGRPDTEELSRAVLQQLGAAVQELSGALLRDAQALATAGATYAVTELRAAGSRTCG